MNPLRAWTSLLSGIRVSDIRPNALSALADAVQIQVVEKDGDTIIRDYLTSVKKVSDVNSLVL
ncbi:MAG: hypothetical protein IJ636_02720 [Bacteroidales bacterium]|nr:hypothetical protein [Bacteroidales bacterium]